MSELFDNVDLCVKLNKLCQRLDVTIPVEPGCHVVFSGQSYSVISVRHDRLAVVDEFTPLPVQESSIVYITDWLNDDACVIVPGVEMLLQIIFDATGFFPTLIPGVEAAREVWKVQHPAAEQPYIFKTPNAALLELAVHLLQIKHVH